MSASHAYGKNSIAGLLLAVFLLTIGCVQAQDTLYQSIKGKVIDKDTRVSLPGATVLLNNGKADIGSATDENGNFLLQNVPIGRQSIVVRFMGYQSLELNNLIVRSGKELILEIELHEMVLEMDEVQVLAQNRKDRPNNTIATVSARSFSVEETNRYAGSYGDPARMVANYAGVMSSRDNRNDIIIRGNSPLGLQYQVNGIEIANPNHFGATGTTGGPITMLNTNLMASSDFLTGAFPAEYGNALSGVFDIKLRPGNNSKREYWGQLGWNGLEFGAEGPFSKNSGASYVAAYRYSFIHLLELAGIKFEESAQYQDLSFHLVFPTKKAGVFSLMGIGGLSAIEINDSKKPVDEWIFTSHGEDIETKSAMGTIGLNHHYLISSSARIQSSLSILGSDITSKVDSFSVVQPQAFTTAGEASTEVRYRISSRLYKKLNTANIINLGLTYTFNQVNYADSQYRHKDYQYQTNIKTQYGLSQAFGQWQHKYGNGFQSYLGLHLLHLGLNQTTSLEPRAGVSWEVNPMHRLSFGAGLHSQMQATVLYFVESPLSDGSTSLTNEDMRLSKSLQFVLGHDYLMNENLRLKSEVYYQYLYDIPVKESLPQFSVINLGTEYFVDRQDSLLTLGSGTNYGVEFTLERFMHKRFFYLFTGSWFRSQYQAFDKITRSTSYDGNFVFNAVGGYELPLGRNKQRTLILGLKVTLAGGRPYVPYDVDATVAAGEVVYDWENAYTLRHPNYFRSSFRVGIRRNKKKFSMEFVLDLQYRADYTYVYLYRIDVVTGEVVQDYTMGFYPNSAIRIMF